VRHRAGASWHLAADDLVAGSGVALAERLLERNLAALPPAVAEVAGVCAAFGEAFRAVDVAAVLPAEIDLDAGVAIARLVKAGILERAGDLLRFAHPLVRRAIEARVTPAARRSLAAAILARVLATAPDDVAAIALHASRAGDDARAAAAHRRVAHDAERRHRYVDAEEAYGAALAHSAAPADRRELHARRGEARFRLHRLGDALADFRAARAVDAPAAESAALLLGEATVLDWMNDFVGSADAARRAAAVAPPELALRCDLALGRSRFREERLPEAIDLLGRVADAAGVDYETRIVALTLLAPALAMAERLEEAERRYTELIARARAAGDSMHLGVAYLNRQFLWVERRDMARLAEDTDRAIAYARELGYATIERSATYNLAEALLWEDRLDDARRLAARARHIQMSSLGEAPDAREALLVARVACARGDAAEAADSLRWIREHCAPETLSPLQRALIAACELSIHGGAAAEWDGVVRAVEACALQREHAEVLRLAQSP
jgi:tetratricopeptide (TPR) repeat protein